jgi:hypothetical protein
MTTTDSSVVSWLEGVDHQLRDLLTAAEDASRHQRPGRGRAVSASDGLRSAVESLQRWTVEHPCPPMFAERFEILLARYGFISLVTEDEASLPVRARFSTAINRLRVLNADLRAFLDDLEEHHREQRCGAPVD